MTEGRKNFDVKGQKENDVLAAIKVVTPVISIIREWGKADRELSKVKTEINKLQKEVKAIDAVLEIFPKSSITKVLKEEKEQREQKAKNLEGRKDQLEENCTNLIGEVINYQEYVRVFRWIDEEMIKFLFDPDLSETGYDLYAIIFFVDNCSDNREKVREIFNESFPERKGISKAFVENKVLKYLKTTLK